ncbi:TrkH family potassium uptake protein [Facklamia lactis]|uniref:TrkH family potassium uptake protein n=1 Tax=Facklamia lactis TaxID=2749967 RepID=UPI0018CE18B9|nr:TrkH family potassium uptake protein [Facklamia lactis]MBG9981091.1 Trk family potassium uptake protein [Facklamia lactis]
MYRKKVAHIIKLYGRQKDKIVEHNPAKLFLFSYLALIIIGALLLNLPIANQSGQSPPFIDSVFTATSAVCVTGLVTLTSATHWTSFGQLVIILLIQIGGIGIMTGAGAISLLINRRFSIRDRLYLAEEKSVNSIKGIVKLTKNIIFLTLFIELIGALLLSFQFVPEFGWLKGIGFSIFYSISAFCNAGFDIIGEASLAPYVDHALVSLTIMGLIICGGLGFSVFIDLFICRKWQRFKLHTKLVLVTTGLLIMIPFLIFLIAEWNNPDTMGHLDLNGKLVASLFQAVTPRTAGFLSIYQDKLTSPSLLVTLFLMFVGGAPAGTAGGLKVTTLAIILLFTYSNIIKRKDTVAFHRRVPKYIINKAISIMVVSIVWIGVVLFLLTLTEQHLSLSDLVYEVVSAYGTVGLSRGITADLSLVGKILIMVTMIFGKIGPMAMVYAFLTKNASNNYREAEESVMVG